MTIPSVLIKDTLLNEAPPFIFGGLTAWAVYIGKMPEKPDRVITIYDATGGAPNPRWLLDYPSIQIKVRGGQNDYLAAANKAYEVRNRLLGKESYDAFDGLGDRIVMINAIGDVSFLGWGGDELVRPEFVFNLRLIIEPSPTTSPTHREPL